MSQGKVDILKRAFTQFEQGNFWVPECFGPEVRIRWLDGVGTKAETVGLQDMSNFMVNWLETFEGLTLVAEPFIDTRAPRRRDRLMAGTGEGLGCRYTTAPCRGVTLRHGRAVSVTAYEEPGDALEAVGLSE